MPVFHADKTVSHSVLDCDGLTKITLSFEAEPDLITTPADMVLILDRSGSMNGTPLALSKKAAKELILTVAKASGSDSGQTLNNGSQMGLVSFADTASVNASLTTDVSALDDAVDALISGGKTNHKDAFETAQELLEQSSKPRRAIIMFTDGETNTGGDPESATEKIKDEGIEIFCIGLMKNPALLDRWASEPASDHVASTDDVNQLQAVFAKVATEVVQAGARHASIREVLNPDFKIAHIYDPSHGDAEVLNPQTLEWTMDSVGAAGRETASLSFDILHIGTSGGKKAVNASIVYADRDQNTLTFPEPEVEVTCGGAIIQPEPCPLPASFVVESCKDAAIVKANETTLTGLGRIVQVDAVIQNVCPGKRVAAAILLTEMDADGVEHARGTKTVMIPPQPGDTCQDVQLNCISFVVPEALDASGAPESICNTRSFRARVLANYVDTDFVCCDQQTVIV